MRERGDNKQFSTNTICFSGFTVKENLEWRPENVNHFHIDLEHYYDLANLVNTGWIMENEDGSFSFNANWSNTPGDWGLSQADFGIELSEIFRGINANGYGVGAIRYSDKDGNITIFHPSTCKVNGDGDVDVMYFTGRYYTDGTTFEERTLAIKPDGTFEVSLIVQP